MKKIKVKHDDNYTINDISEVTNDTDINLHAYIDDLILKKYFKADDNHIKPLNNALDKLYKELDNRNILYEMVDKTTLVDLIKVNVNKLNQEIEDLQEKYKEDKGTMETKISELGKLYENYIDENKIDTNYINIIIKACILRIKTYIGNQKLKAARIRANRGFNSMFPAGPAGGSKKRKYSFKKLPKRKRRNNKSNKAQAKKRGKRLNRSKKMSR